MIIKHISQIGSKAIRTRAGLVKNVHSKETNGVIKNLVDTMRHANLVGMAAPQIGVGKRIFVTEVRATTIRKNLKQDELRVFVNPGIIQKSKKLVSGYEGCGSVGSSNLFGPVRRHKNITVVATNEVGARFTLRASGLLARIIQHEIDHLNGIVFLDRVRDTKKLLGREEYKRKFNKR